MCAVMHFNRILDVMGKEQKCPCWIVGHYLRDNNRISELLQIQLILQGYMSCIRGSSEIPLLSLTHLVSAPYSGLTHGKTAHQSLHMVTMCSVTCEIYSVAIVIVREAFIKKKRGIQ